MKIQRNMLRFVTEPIISVWDDECNQNALFLDNWLANCCLYLSLLVGTVKYCRVNEMV